MKKCDYKISTEVDEDGDFFATCREFPHLSAFSDDPGKAYYELTIVIEEVISMLRDDGKTPPDPIVDKGEFSGRFTSRVPIDLHKRINDYAILNNVSLNQGVNQLLNNGLMLNSLNDAVDTIQKQKKRIYKMQSIKKPKSKVLVAELSL